MIDIKIHLNFTTIDLKDVTVVKYSELTKNLDVIKEDGSPARFNLKAKNLKRIEVIYNDT